MIPEHTSPDALQHELSRLMKLLDEALDELYKTAHEWAESEDAYRLARSTAYLAASGTVGERTAHTDKATSAERRRAHLADALRQAALESVRARRTQLEALRSVAYAARMDMQTSEGRVPW